MTAARREHAALEQLARDAFTASAPPAAPRATAFVARKVHTLDGVPHHWLVAATSGDRILGWARFTPSHVLLGVSFLPPRPGQPDAFPPAADWLDADTVRARAAALARPGETAGTPLLSFDGSPDRLAWAVPLQRDGARRWVFVAGEAAWTSAA